MSPISRAFSRATDHAWVLIVEAMAQVGGVVLTQMPEAEGRLFLFADKVRFRRHDTR